MFALPAHHSNRKGYYLTFTFRKSSAVSLINYDNHPEMDRVAIFSNDWRNCSVVLNE